MAKTATAEALKVVEFHVLLALAGGPMHGYALAKQMEVESHGRVRMLPGNLYAVIRRLLVRSLVEEADAPADASRQDPRRRFFALTTNGRHRLAEESRQMARVADVALRRLVEAGDGEMS